MNHPTRLRMGPDQKLGCDSSVLAARPLLALRGVYKIREKGGQSFELRVPSLAAARGEFIAFVGASGCGKSTLLDMLALVTRPTRAESFAFHLPTHDEPYDIMALSDVELSRIRRQSIGYVLQTGGLLPFLTVQDNITLPCRLNGMHLVEDTMQTLVESLGIADQLKKKPQFLSGGQRQRAAIARALVHTPSLVLADEPTAAIDTPTAAHICQILKRLTRQMQITLCMVTHHQDLVTDIADRTFVFEVHQENPYKTYARCYERNG